MTRTEIVSHVSEALRESQRMSGRSDAFPLTEATVPMGDLVDFDSLNAIEATQLLEERLGGALPENLFADETARRPLSVGAVVDRLMDLVTSAKES